LKVLVTGTSGLIGRVVAIDLAGHGHDVLGIDRRRTPRDLRDLGIPTVRADIVDSDALSSAMEGRETVVHCAAFPSPHRRTPAEIMRVNAIGTQNVLEAAMAGGARKVIVTSSIGALGFSFPKHPCLPDYLPVDTAHPRRPQDIYGLTKLINEESAAAATRRTGLATVVLRPPMVLNLPREVRKKRLYTRIDRQSEIRLDDLWAYIDIHDLAEAYRLAVERDMTGHSVFHVMADDVLARQTAPDLIRRFLPEHTECIDRLTGNSLYDLRPIEAVLGFVARRTWRNL
jgi:UDP-glucose 4-epimerase